VIISSRAAQLAVTTIRSKSTDFLNCENAPLD